MQSESKKSLCTHSKYFADQIFQCVGVCFNKIQLLITNSLSDKYKLLKVVLNESVYAQGDIGISVELWKTKAPSIQLLCYKEKEVKELLSTD